MKKNKKTFNIPQIDSKEKERDHFVSPFFGTKVKDEIVVPKSTMEGNINDRFKDFRSVKQEKGKDELQKEFGVLGSEEVKDLISKRKPVKVVDAEVRPEDRPYERKEPVKVIDAEIRPEDRKYEKDYVAEEEPEVPVEEMNSALEDDNFITLEREEAPEKEEKLVPFGIQTIIEEPEEKVEDLEIVEDEFDVDQLDIPEEPEAYELDENAKEVLNLFDMMGESKNEEEDIDVFEEVKPSKKTETIGFKLPELSLLTTIDQNEEDNEEDIQEQRELIDNTLAQFKVGGKVVNYTAGPTVTQYEVKLEEGVMINKLTNIANNIKMNLAAVDIRIEAPIPGKSTIGIEVPNKNRKLVNFGNIIDENFIKNSKPLDVALGVNLSGQVVYGNIEKMPHGLIAGATGSGKSVCIDTILMSLLLKSTPEDLKLILIDPKRVGLAAYSKVPHLATPIIHDAKVASESLKWAVNEMERRYDLMFSVEARDIKSYNKKIKTRLDEGFSHIPNIVIVIEEMADLMAQAASEVELSVARIAQKARAAGIYLIVATQRPSVDVIKGSIKSNIPTRIALKVSSNTDSMTIIDYGGAESLLGNGDMLYSIAGMPLQRLQGAFVSEEEIDAVTGYLSKYDKEYLFSTESLVTEAEKSDEINGYDELFIDVAEYVISTNYASINKIQRNFNIGYNRASDLFNQLTSAGIVSSPQSKTPRKVLIDMEQFHARYK